VGFAFFVRWTVLWMTSVLTLGLTAAAGSESEPPALLVIATPARPPRARSVTDTAVFVLAFSISDQLLLLVAKD
jgi:hypothetical protein